MTPVERMARRIEREIDNVPMVDAAPSQIRAIRARNVARAALEAIREPSEAMIEASLDMHRECEIREIWQEMIDAALSET